MKLTAIGVILSVLCVAPSLYAQEGIPSRMPTAAEIYAIKSGQYRRPISPEELAAIKLEEADVMERVTRGRLHYRNGEFLAAARDYEGINFGRYPSSNWELAESYMRAGLLQEAIKAYRSALYQKVKLRESVNSTFSPRATLPEGASSWEEARNQFPDQDVEVVVSDDVIKLGRYALLLVQNREYAEAVGIYQSALKYVPKPEWQSALSLGNLTALNFDRRRFEAATYTLMATTFQNYDWIHLKYEKPLAQDEYRERNVWMDEALRIRPDFAPALYIKGNMIVSGYSWVRKEDETRAVFYLDKAQQSARSNELRALIARSREKAIEELRLNPPRE